MSRSERRLRRSDRLRNRKDFLRVNRTARRRTGAHFLALFAPSRAPRARRLGLTVGKRVGNAVERNRVKRRVREWFRRERALLPPGTDLVVIARRGAAQLDGREIETELAALAQR